MSLGYEVEGCGPTEFRGGMVMETLRLRAGVPLLDAAEGDDARGRLLRFSGGNVSGADLRAMTNPSRSKASSIALQSFSASALTVSSVAASFLAVTLTPFIPSAGSVSFLGHELINLLARSMESIVCCEA
jgi:hypothetical protein